MTSRSIPRTVKRMVAAVAVTPLLVAMPIAAHAASAPASKTVSYLGRDFTVPASWPASHLAGRADALLIQPTSSVSGAASSGGATDDTTSHQIVSTGGGVTVTATYGSSPQLDLSAIASAGLPTPPSGSTGTTSANPATQAQAQVQPQTPAKAPSVTPRAASREPRAASRTATASAAHAAGTATVASSAVNYTGEAFDECEDPSPSNLGSWSSSPFRGVGIYIGGANMACTQPNYTAADITSDISAGWHFYLIYVGLQAPTNICGCSTFTSPAQQGAAAAEDAVQQGENEGFGQGTPIFFDLEAYTSSTSVTSQVLAFVNAWT